jgi:hypothetical protein
VDYAARKLLSHDLMARTMPKVSYLLKADIPKGLIPIKTGRLENPAFLRSGKAEHEETRT